MSNAPVKSNKENGMFILDRREFLVGGLALAAMAMLPRFARRARGTPA